MTTDRTGETGRGRGADVPGLDASTFETLAQHHRREIHVHCYRMLACHASDQERFPRRQGGR